MKAKHILFALAALVVSAACTKTNELPEQEGVWMTFRAYQEGAQETKTTVRNGGSQVFWESADEIKVFFKSSSGKFVSQNKALATVTDFSGTLNILVGANEGAGSANQTWGLYPYRDDATYDGEYVTTTLPAAQTGRAGSFAKNTHICLARSGGNDLAFYNVTGGLRFSLTQEGITSVTLEGNNGETLAGKVKLGFDGKIPAVKEVSEGETTLTLTAPDGGSFETGKWYYIEAIPGTLSNGFKMVFSKGNETAKISSSGSVTISRGKYGSLADADEGLIFKESSSDDPLPSSSLGWDVFITHDVYFEYDSLPAAGARPTYTGEYGLTGAPRVSYGPREDKNSANLTVTWTEMNQWVFNDPDVNMSAELFGSGVSVDGQYLPSKYLADEQDLKILLTTDTNGNVIEPGAQCPAFDDPKTVVAPLTDLHTYYCNAIDIACPSPTMFGTWWHEPDIISLTLTNEVEGLGKTHYVYVLYPARDNTKNIGVVERFSYTIL